MMHDCPHCGERLDLSHDDRGARSAHGAAIGHVDQGEHAEVIAHCAHCSGPVRFWAQIDDVSALD